VKYDCGLIGDAFYVARDKEHHYLIKFFTIVNGKWIMGNKRNVIIKIEGTQKFTMTMGYYEEAPVLRRKIKEELLKQLMDYVSGQ
jgi:hypothetical protein